MIPFRRDRHGGPSDRDLEVSTIAGGLSNAVFVASAIIFAGILRIVLVPPAIARPRPQIDIQLPITVQTEKHRRCIPRNELGGQQKCNQ
jgi:hypothetical protein